LDALRRRARGLALLALLAALAGAAPAAAVGPARIGLGDRQRWPEPLTSAAAFDRASRAEILSFTAALAETQALEGPALAAAVGIAGSRVNAESVARWRGEVGRRLEDAFRSAAASCAPREPFCAADALGPTLPDAYRGWREDAREFHRVYALELLRLAALFPAPTSEILTFSPRERTGDELGDRQFVLTFDDGPTETGGTTDATLAALRRAGVSGVFFLLGEALERRVARDGAAPLQQAYAGMCVGSHGWRHDSHQRLPEWQRSVAETAALAQATFGPLYRPLFRPPFGQRRADGDDFFAARGLTLVLWNLDSQDWNPDISAEAVGARVLSLMLLWRRGVILMHDVHAKAAEVVPGLVTQGRAAGVAWLDCRRYGE
jgi:peptidoglycan/xylan/chitin deacetylase (PgdA/CDA1 family)